MKIPTLFAVLALGTVPFAAQAAGTDLSKLSTMQNTGEWQMTITRKMSVPGTKMALPAKTLTRKECLTKKDLDKLSHFTPKNVNGMTCKLTKKNLSGKTFTFATACTGKQGKMNMDGRIVFDSKNASHSHIEMNGTMQNMPIEVTLDTKARRIGSKCTSASKSPAGK